MARTLKQVLVGNPLQTREAAEQRLSNPIALAVFSSDALSSVAYATGEILLMLVLAGTGALRLAWPISVAIAALLVIVTISYRQTIRAYPSGGGAYIVARENLGTLPGLVAGGSLLVGYVLTVAVSVAAGTAAITSAWPGLVPYTVPLTLAFITVVAIANLRGLRESGAIFAVPTYTFIAVILLMLVVAYYKQLVGGGLVVPSAQEAVTTATGALTLFLILRAFSSGCAAMTGVEAIANGVQSFRKPEARNAVLTMAWMAGLLGVLFLGISGIAVLTKMHPSGHETVISQIARATFGVHLAGTGILYYLVSLATMAILVVAANTSYAGFPALSSFMARDGFLPNLLQDRGYRLVHSNGIVLLTTSAGLLLVLFGGSTSRLIPLYAIGVFLSFTLSQAGMVGRWWRLRERGWQSGLAINAVGSAVTGMVTIILAITKFVQGAWIALALVALLVVYFLWVREQYSMVAEHLQMPIDANTGFALRSGLGYRNHVVVLVGTLDRRIVPALQYAQSIHGDTIEAIFVDATGEHADEFRASWDTLDSGIPLTVIDSPFREIIGPITDYVRSIPRLDHRHLITVVIPQFVPEDWADLGGVYVYRAGLRFWIKRALFFERNVIVVDVPYHLRTDDPGDDSTEVGAHTV